MLPAFITTLLWSYCVIAARRSVEQLGENLANVARILVALLTLGILAHLFGDGLQGGGLFFFLLSGVVGFGLGDIGIFYALPRLGSRLTILMAQCLAAPVAGLAEWLWMGTVLSSLQILAVGIILGGIVIALFPERLPEARSGSFLAGTAFGLLAALGQGLGAVLSRKAYAEANSLGYWGQEQGVLDSIWMGATTGYQRLIGGALVIVLFFIMGRFIRTWRSYPRGNAGADSLGRKTSYVLLNAASGPILGIICFQWALASTPSAIVQPIVAMTPLVVMPLAWILEGDRPNRRSVFGALICVGGVLVLALS